MIIECMKTDLPLPVVPATKRCGKVSIDIEMTFFEISCPSGITNLSAF